MKRKATSYKVLLIAVILMLTGKISNAQTTSTTFNYWIDNDTLMSLTTFEFDVFIQSTSVDFPLRSLQPAYSFAIGFVPTGSTTTVTYIAGTSSFGYTPGSYQKSVQSATVPFAFSHASTTANACGVNGWVRKDTVKQVGRYRITSSAGFNCQSSNPACYKTGDAAIPAVTLRTGVFRWGDLSGDCDTATNVTITTLGTYTSFAGSGTLLDSLNNMRPAITQQPLNVIANQGSSAQFTVNATGNALLGTIIYQWFDSIPNVSSTLVTDGLAANGATYSGASTNTLLITNLPISLNGHLFYSVVSQCPNVPRTSNVASLTVNAAVDPCVNNPNINDGNACTDDFCDPATGIITHPANWTADNDACTNDFCDPATGTVTRPTNWSQNSNLCDVESCDPATGNVTSTPVNVNDNNACTADACDPATGTITHNDLTVNDNNACTNDVCNPATGVTTHTANWSQNSNLCDVESCDPATGLVTSTPVNVNDNNACTADACDPATGTITHNDLTVNDNNACTNDVCNPSTGVTTHTANWGQNSNLCDVESCDPASGLVTSTPVSTTDNNACTNDVCDPATGNITHPANWSQNSNLCDVESCDPATGLVTSSPVNINDNNACTIDACDPATGNITHADQTVNDNNACTNDVCNPATGITTHTDNTVNDNNACTNDVCNPATGVTNHTANWSQNSNLCDVESCDPATGLVTSAPVNINDNNACTIDACDPATGNITHADQTVNDNNACTNDVCNPSTGITTHTDNTVNDNNACTNDVCNPSTGITTHTANWSQNSNLCDVESCNPATGLVTSAPVNVNDNNACTADACDPATGSITHNDLTVNDNNACTNDVCDPATGVTTHPVNWGQNSNLCDVESCDPATGLVTSTPVSTTDNNACTNDVCDPATGNISHTANWSQNSNLCDVESCDPATGSVTSSPVNINDNNACTSDACDPATGSITHSDLTVADGNACTNDVCDPATGITSYTPLPGIQDNNFCTDDACNTSTGVITHTPIAGIDDGIACTVDACDPANGNITHTAGTVEICGNGIDDDCDQLIDEGCSCTTPPTANANGPYSSCGNKQLNGLVGGSATGGTWSTTTGGTFSPNATTLNATYIPSATDLTNGSVILTLTSNNPAGVPCSSAVSTATLTFTSVNDNNMCTVDACDQATGLATHSPLPSINDDNVCTIDACNPNTGLITHTQKVVVGTSTTPAGCSANDGTATANPSGGTAQYTYLWSPGNQTSQTATGLAGGNYTVVVTDADNCTGTASVFVASSGNVSTPGSINGPIGGCRGQNGVVYCIDPVPGASSYQWTLPSGVSIVGSTSGPCITVNFSNSFNGGNLCVRALSSCGNSQYQCVNLKRITAMPGKPLHISGPSPICPGSTATYSIASVLWATSYEWSVTGGLIINSGQGTTSISVTAPAGFTSGTISVKAKNCKGTSPARIKTITGLPVTPVWDFEDCEDNATTVCGGSTYKYEVHFNPNVTCYLWTAPQGAVIHDQSGNFGNPLLIPTGHNDDVTITFPQGFVSGVVTVSACSPCGPSAVAILNVSSVPAQPGSISGPSPVCKNSTRSYSISSVPGATYYKWEVTGGATIRSGQGTRNVTVKFNSATSTTAVLSVKAKNECGYSEPRTKTISVNLNCRTLADGTETELPELTGEALSSLSAYPNPTSGITMLTFNTNRNAKFTISIVDMLGKVMSVESIQSVKGYNEKEINLDVMANGIYLIFVQTEGEEPQRLQVVVE